MPLVTGVRRRTRLAISGALALSLLATACSSEDGGEPAAADATPSASASSSTEEPAPSPSPSSTDEPSPTETPSGELGEIIAEYDLPPVPPAVRGVYSHVYSFWGENWDALVDLVETTELNSIVVDVKDEAGTLLWDIDHPLTEAGGADWRDDFDGVEERLQQLKDADGWAIARIACFKDTLAAVHRPDLAVQDQSGRAWKASILLAQPLPGRGRSVVMWASPRSSSASTRSSTTTSGSPTAGTATRR